MSALPIVPISNSRFTIDALINWTTVYASSLQKVMKPQSKGMAHILFLAIALQ